MKTDDFIKGLASELAPVKKQSSPPVFAFKYLMALSMLIVLGIWMMSVRADFKVQASNLFFIIDTIFNILLLLSGIFLVALLSTAGRSYNRHLKYVMLGLFLFVLAFNAYRLSLTTAFFSHFVINVFDLKCFGLVMLFSLVSMALIGWATSKRIVLNPATTGGIIGLLCFSVGSFVLNMHCPIVIDQHVAIYHTLLPMITGTVIGCLGGRAFLKF